MSLLNSKNNGIKALLQYLVTTGDKIIVCIAACQYTYVWFAEERFWHVSGNIKQIESWLADNNLFRAHKSYLVNLNYIIDIDYDKRSITMEGGHIAKLGKHKVKSLKLLMANREKPEVLNFLSTKLVERKYRW
jgi:DNA-binding LytR/AlgR family response regulator